MPIDKPTGPEEEYFKKLDEEKKKELRKKFDEERKKLERKYQKELHWMKCPKCGSNLKEIDFKGIKIDRCQECEGIWLDKGELEMISGEESGIIRHFIERFFK